STEWILMGVSVAVAALAIFLAYTVFGKGAKVPGEDYSGLKKIIYDKFYVDEAYQAAFVKPMTSLSTWTGKFMENTVFGGISTGTFKTISGIGGLLQRLQTGNIGTYIGLITLGVIIILGISLGSEFWGAFKSK